ncbi:DUF72 domain-containing protein [Synechococcus elongatus]|uniref:DUF72 domain-containing protein n=1 Tax=Synechococcus elongatus PCC 11802 TaxID=2283154 RepID=A0AAT9K2B0_SYNEL|nr:DUF72 domain-containing protein [Synechococcus elongatus]
MPFHQLESAIADLLLTVRCLGQASAIALRVTMEKQQFWLGCAVWAFRDWVGSFYPAGTGSDAFLRRYGERLTAVEGNTTFYSIPSTETVHRWRQETPEGFRFCLKLPRSLSHAGSLVAQIEAAAAFRRQMEPLGDRLGPAFLQLPPRYGPGEIRDLAQFLAAWPVDQWPLAVEPRHPEWFQPQPRQSLNRLLQRYGCRRVLLDTRPLYDGTDDPQATSDRRKPKLPLHSDVIGDYAFVRFISHPNRDRNLNYLAEWQERLRQWFEQGTTVYFFVHCPQEIYSPATAIAFQQQLEKAGIAVPPLPTPPAPAQQQLILFS